MRVDFTNLGFEPPENSKPGRAGQTGTAAAPSIDDYASSSSSVDQARFSFDQTRVQSLEVQALTAPEVRQAKVAPLQQAIANGDYTVDSGKVADAIVAEAGSGRIG